MCLYGNVSMDVFGLMSSCAIKIGIFFFIFLCFDKIRVAVLLNTNDQTEECFSINDPSSCNGVRKLCKGIF